MKSRLLADEEGRRTFVLVFEEDDEVHALLLMFAEKAKIRASRFTAIGALKELTVGFFDPTVNEYKKTHWSEQLEVLALTGNVADKDGAREVHAHVVVAKADGSAHGGHLMSAIVRPTLELILTELPEHLHRTVDAKTGLALIRL